MRKLYAASIAAVFGLAVLAGCSGDGDAPQVPQVPPIPAPPQMDPESCYNMNNTVYQIETAKKLSGHYGEGEEKRLEQVRFAALALGCYIDPNFQPRPPVPAPKPAVLAGA
jgi:hypothetical protein